MQEAGTAKYMKGTEFPNMWPKEDRKEIVSDDLTL